ncbi:hypothetical protein PS15m_003774 [Mucor circinelloides]
MSTPPPRHIQSELHKLSKQEPADKDSIEHKDWELAYLKLQLDRSRLTVRVQRESKNKQIAEMAKKAASSLESLRQSKEHEIEQIERKYTEQLENQKLEIERLKQLCNHYKDLTAFYQLAKNGDAVVEELNIKIDELESHVDFQSQRIQELEEINTALQAEDPQPTSDASNASQNDKDLIDSLRQENQDMQQDLDTQRNEKLDLMITMEEHIQMRCSLTATIDSLTKDKLELEAKCRKLHQQVGSTAKPTLKAKTVYQRKTNMTQKSLNTMFYDQTIASAASSPSSTQSAPSPVVSARRTTSATIDQANQDTSNIPLKRALSTTLSDKTNSKTQALMQDNKGKSHAVQVKQEQVEVDLTAVIENLTEEQVLPASATRKKPKSNTSVPITSTSTVRRLAKPASSPTTPDPFLACSGNHRKDRGNMIGGTCTACVNVSVHPVFVYDLCSLFQRDSFMALKQLLQTLMGYSWN